MNLQGQPGSRRPIAARRLGAIRAAASLLAGSGVSPNAVSASSVLFAGLAAVAAAATAHAVPGGLAERGLWAAVAAGVLLRLLANMFDGLIAVEHGRASITGGLWNEFPDRVSDAAVLIGLGCAAGGSLALGLAAAAAAILTAYVRELGRAEGARAHFVGPMSKPQRMFAVIAVALWLAAAPVAWRPSAGAEWLGLPGLTLGVIAVLSLACCARRLRRIAGDLREVAEGAGAMGGNA